MRTLRRPGAFLFSATMLTLTAVLAPGADAAPPVAACDPAAGRRPRRPAPPRAVRAAVRG
ncbi:hypothetical protein [Nocardia abscessus]|uniref:hypothetical protein n=1 Tax=Nocardia abscessus TaxID=120957 RepID=UPI002456B062|nr:hypothetical protein [Nocardia abscessus]